MSLTTAEKNKRYREKNREKLRLYHKEYRKAHKAEASAQGKAKYLRSQKAILLRGRLRRNAIKQEMVAAYGGQCACCGEKNPKFLSLDHKNNDGHRDRRRDVILWYHLKKQGWPKDHHQILCFNCNLGRAANYGVCPHHDIFD